MNPNKQQVFDHTDRPQPSNRERGDFDFSTGDEASGVQNTIKTTGSQSFRKSFRGWVTPDPLPGSNELGEPEPDRPKECDTINLEADLGKLEDEICVDNKETSRAAVESATAITPLIIQPSEPVVKLSDKDGSLTRCNPVGPSSGPVRLADEIEWMEMQFGRYVTLPKGIEVVLALWCVNTYTYQNFRYCPYLALVSATPQCGKTRVLNLLGAMSSGNPQPTAMPTAPVSGSTRSVSAK